MRILGSMVLGDFWLMGVGDRNEIQHHRKHIPTDTIPDLPPIQTKHPCSQRASLVGRQGPSVLVVVPCLRVAC